MAGRTKKHAAFTENAQKTSVIRWKGEQKKTQPLARDAHVLMVHTQQVYFSPTEQTETARDFLWTLRTTRQVRY